jgi:hypothetical protein
MPRQWCAPDGARAVEGVVGTVLVVVVVAVELAAVVEVPPVAALANAAPPPAIAPVMTSVATIRVGLTFIDPPLWLEPERYANSLTICRKHRSISVD